MNRVKQLFNAAGHSLKPLLLDGAMGSLLQARGIESHSELWMSQANLLHPFIVEEIHSEYIIAGADIITTNTFRTNPAAANNSGYSTEDLVKAAVQIALDTRSDSKEILIAGSNAPAEDCYKVERTLSKDELIYNHHKHIDLLISSGCDFILNETQSHLDEINIVARYCSTHDIPFVLSLFFNDDLKLLSGEDIWTTVDLLECYNPLAIGFNCIHPEVFSRVIIKYKPNLSWGFYLNLGTGNYSDEKIIQSLTPPAYLEYVKEFVKSKPSFLGACCGSNPSHIKLLREYLDELYRN